MALLPALTFLEIQHLILSLNRPQLSSTDRYPLIKVEDTKFTPCVNIILDIDAYNIEITDYH